jgi:hypothetical protein
MIQDASIFADLFFSQTEPASQFVFIVGPQK